jgi:DNA-binding NarL/FixJ family response regulator
VETPLIVVAARSRETFDWLSEACRTRGWATVWAKPHSLPELKGVTAGVFDAAHWNATERDDLRHFAEKLHPVPVVALLSFPRIEDEQQAIAAGANVVLSKPTSVEDLLWTLKTVRSPFPAGRGLG